MAFNPTSTIYLCNVPIDNTYKNQITFSGANGYERRENQHNFFMGLKPLRPFQNYLTVRKTLPNGSLQSSVKVDANIDELYNFNYMFYQNANHGTRWFYAFITKLIYINEGTTEIVFETDVWQTWHNDIGLKESFVLREHSKTDLIGDNIVAEPINIDEFEYEEVFPTYEGDSETYANWFKKAGYLVISSEPPSGTFGDLVEAAGKELSGIYQGLYFYFYHNYISLQRFVTNLKQESILAIVCVPKITMLNATIANAIIEGEQPTEGYVGSSDKVEKTIRIPNSRPPFKNHDLKNNKLYTSQFYRLQISNNSGDSGEYAFEDFNQENGIEFILHSDISTSPSVCIVPANYRGATNNLDFSLTLGTFPQCSFNCDAYKLWLAKNGYGNALNAGSGILQVLMGGVMATSAVATGSFGMALGAVGTAANGAKQVLGAINEQYKASVAPNIANGGAPKNNLLTSMEENRFVFRVKRIKSDLAKTVDEFLSMYGYQTNELKLPNIDCRKYYNYVQTSECNIIGSIPADDMNKLKSMFNNGVTFWRSYATVGNYNVDNVPY